MDFFLHILLPGQVFGFKKPCRVQKQPLNFGRDKSKQGKTLFKKLAEDVLVYLLIGRKLVPLVGRLKQKILERGINSLSNIQTLKPKIIHFSSQWSYKEIVLCFSRRKILKILLVDLSLFFFILNTYLIQSVCYSTIRFNVPNSPTHLNKKLICFLLLQLPFF